MTPQQRIKELQQEVEQLEKDLARAEGGGGELTKQMAEFNCRTVKEARAKLAEWQAEAQKIEEQFDASIKTYRAARLST